MPIASKYFLSALCILVVFGWTVANGQDALKPPAFTKEQITEAEQLIKTVFRDEYQKAVNDKSAGVRLAQTLLGQSNKITQNPDVRYVVLIQARDLATLAGAQRVAFTAIAQLAKYHQIDELAMQLAVLESTVKTEADSKQLTELANLSLALANSAADRERFDLSVRLSGLAVTAAKKANDPVLSKKSGERRDQLMIAHTEAKRLKPFLDRLQKNSNDAEANLEAGKSWCFMRDQWEKGLPYLAKGNDPMLRQIAVQDLKHPLLAIGQIQIAQEWQRLAGKYQSTMRRQMLRRSLIWYRQAMSRLKGQVPKSTDKQIADLKKILPERFRVTDISTEKRLLKGHTAEVLGLAIHPNGRRAVSCSADRTIREWDLLSGKEMRIFKGHIGTIFGVAYTPDGKHILSTSEDRTVRLWDCDTGKELRRLIGPGDFCNSVAVSPDGKLAAAGGQERIVYVWDLATGKRLYAMRGHRGAIFRLAFSPTENVVASCSDDQSVRLWDLNTGKQSMQLQGHTGQVLGISFSPDGKQLLSSSEDRSVRLWDLATGKTTKQFTGHTSIVGAAAFAPDGLRFLSTGDDRSLRLWDVRTGKLIRQLQAHTDAVYGVSFSPDGRHALSCSLDKTVRYWGERR